MKIKVSIEQMKEIRDINSKISLREARELIISVAGNMSLAKKIASHEYYYRSVEEYIEGLELEIKYQKQAKERLENFDGKVQILTAFA